MDDVLLNKAAIMERCVRRVTEIYAGTPSRLLDPTSQDAIVLNLERACQAAIDAAMYVVARDHLGVPQASGDAFTLLEKAGRLDGGLAASLRAMVGFRNVAVHEYQKLSVDILRTIVESRGADSLAFCAALGLRIKS
ncbi:MAG: DUF86 domain-containing protein [Acidobacteriota bacterium]